MLTGGRSGGESILLVWIIIYYMLLYVEKFNGILIRADLSDLQKLEILLLKQVMRMMPLSLKALLNSVEQLQILLSTSTHLIRSLLTTI